MSGAVGVCRVCGALFDRRRRNAAGVVVGHAEARTCPRHRWSRSRKVLVDKETRYEDDVACQMFVARFGPGATLDMIAEAFGVSRERVRQIEVEALGKLRAAGVRVFGIDPEDPEERRGPRHDVVDEQDDPDEPELDVEPG